MRAKRFDRKPPGELSTGFDPLDGVDPRTQQRPSGSSAANRKALQLAAQAARTLAQVLQGECADDVLRELRLEDVRPAPDSGHLLVVLSPGDETVPLETYLEHLHKAGGRLRSEVALAIHRRKAPELIFQVVCRDARTSPFGRAYPSPSGLSRRNDD